ncbi:MAG: diguanylate cyclase [Anaerotignum propionicum]|uniref:diguanylate cyclase domain-containing protein n=1 Tax=Anaerotignum propionicum TaxID=28446 RepID=UPI002B1F088E|nr:diguanylate cyclase [Anaerotignum propionicum]MEA5057675.1 diguanylate cyclase [Anaerotignum propionicum]
MLIDIDHFKSINIALGYGMGDKVLCAVGEMLESIFEETNFISRMDGDLFAIFIPFRVEQEILEQKLEKICHAIAYDNANLKLSLTCSAGVCFSPEHATNYEELYSNAEIALLNARVNRKKRFLFYDKGMKAPLSEEHQQQTFMFLDDVSDGVFICDTLNGEIIYINDTACRLIDKARESCIGASCSAIFGEMNQNFDFAFQNMDFSDSSYEEDKYIKGADVKVHLKAKPTILNGKRLIIYYLQESEAHAAINHSQ